jgi:hypothetical protein
MAAEENLLDKAMACQLRYLELKAGGKSTIALNRLYRALVRRIKLEP